MLFVGDDWAEDHHDVEIQDDDGRRLAGRRLPEGLAGISQLHGLVAACMPAEWADLPEGEAASLVKVGIETERGAWVQALVAAGYEVYPLNPMSVARYRERHSTSGAKSDSADTRTCWLRSSGSTGGIIARWPVTRRRLMRSSSSPGRTRP